MQGGPSGGSSFVVRFIAGGACACALACVPSAAVVAAQGGDRDALRAAIERRAGAQGWSAADVAAIAKAVAERDLRAAPPEQGATLVRDLLPCARELDGALAQRMRVHDAAGAAAALVRIEAGTLALDAARRFADDAAWPWRAVGVRSLVRPGDAPGRARSLSDPEPAVRREAARAAHDAADASDFAALFEAARLDPDRLVRTEAVRAIAALPAAPGDSVALVLRDLWTSADEPLRADVAAAWAAPSLWEHGGREALRAVVAESRGPEAIPAALAILRRRGADPELEHLGVGALARSIASAARLERVAAITQAPLAQPALESAVRAAAGADDLEVRVAALARLAERGHEDAKSSLRALAKSDSALAGRARLALAEAGDRSVQPQLQRDLSATSVGDRLDAALGLEALGVPERAAVLLADADPSVRARVACVVIDATRRHP